jgi:G8 domain-containing protein
VNRPCSGLASAALVVLALVAHGIGSAEARPSRACPGGVLPPGQTNGRDLVVRTHCTVGPGTYNVGNVNILAGGTLVFTDPPSSGATDFWAKSILVENGGALIAGSPTAPIGAQGGVVTIHLYGKDQGAPGGQGIACLTDPRCGVPADTWSSNGGSKVTLPGGVTDYFYQYDPLPYDDGGSSPGFFGYKVLAVSYGGTLQLFGKKGATYSNPEPASSDSGTSWGRLNGTIQKGATTLQVDRQVDWQPGDQIVVTTTDYLPGHSEVLQIQTVSSDARTIGFTSLAPTCSDAGGGVCWTHNGQAYDLSIVPPRLGLGITSAETRAAVALLTRSIRIVSGGDKFRDAFPAESSGYFFGGHTLVRQGVATYQVQGVEFYQLGQGGRIAHYPVHMHMARLTPPHTFVKDSSVHDSMTRWYVLHATHGVTLARNVGYQSIGHGYYIEDGTEINNRLLSNIGIFARAAVDNVQNPRQVPGILAQANSGGEMFANQSDYDHPSVFWIMNGWNDFEYNMAAGAGTCGACYWLVPGANSGPSAQMQWESYASLQSSFPDRAALTPLKRFVGNYCSTAMNSFITVGNTAPCLGVVGGGDPVVNPVANPLAPAGGPYYPQVLSGGGRFATQCDGVDCSQVPPCSAGIEDNCVITLIDRYTSSFHWAQTGFAAMWLRPQWYLLTNSVLSDVQNGGLTMVTGGGYTSADVIPGHWALVRKTAFIGNTQTGNPYASNGSPINPQGLACDAPFNGGHCLVAAEGVSFPMDNFALNQRLLNIYDGPVYQDSNAFLDVQPVHVADCTPTGCVGASKWLAGNIIGLPQDAQGQCYLPNAAIAWKQPNGFYYPPAFHSTNLFFDNVGIRHFVIEPLFVEGTYTTDGTAVAKRYCNQNNAMFTGFTDIDRQTELSDDDGSLTGYVNTISVNLDPFFNAPVEATECASDAPTVTTGTAKTSPYDYVTSVVYPACYTSGTCTNWSVDCTSPSCYGVPLVRQLFTASEGASARPTIRMAGQAVSQRSTLTANHGVYYIDTTLSQTTQQNAGFSNLNVFQPDGEYYVFLLFAKPTTTQTYQLYVGTGYDPTKLDNVVWATQANVKAVPVQFTPPGQVAWPSTWTRSYNASTGVVTVTMDMSFSGFAPLYEAGRQGRCRPASFCTWDTTASACVGTAAAKADVPDADAVCAWATKDVDCPQGGCFGFGVAMSDSFTYDTDQRPAPTPFPTTGPWNAQLVKADPGLSGNCP